MAVSQSLKLTESNVDVASNTSKVRILWQSTQSGESWNGYTRTAKYYVSINGGAETEYSVSYTLPKNSTATIVDKTITVNHKSDGSGTVKVRTWMNTDISAGVVEQTKSLALTTIPRASTIESISCSTAYFDGTITFKYTPKSNSLYNQCSVILGSDYTTLRTINLGQKAASLQTETITLSSDDISYINSVLTDTTTGELVFELTTYRNSAYTDSVGTDDRAITLSLKTTSLTPTAKLTITPVTDVNTDDPVYIKSLSKVKCVFSDVKAKNGATIAKYRFIISGTGKIVETTQGTYTSGYLADAGAVRINCLVYDSRGVYASFMRDIDVLDYKTPTIDSLTSTYGTFPGPTGAFPGAITYKYTPACSAFYSQCKISIGDTTIKTIKHGKYGAQITNAVVFSEDELDAILRTIPNDKQGTLRFTFGTYCDSEYKEQIGEDIYKEITLSIPDNEHKAVYPTWDDVVCDRMTPLNAPLNSIYVKGKSKVKVSVSGLTGKYGATIKSCNVTIAGKNGNPPYTSDYLIASGDVPITITATDSRGFTTTKTYTDVVTVLDYAAPRILPASGEDEVIAARCDEAGNFNANGIYLRIKAKREYSRLEQKNLCQIQYRYRVDGGAFTAWTTILAANASSDEVDTGAILGTLDVASSYFVQVRALDYVGEATSTSITISTEKVYWHRAGSLGSFGFGKYAEDANTFDVAEDKTAIFRGEVRFPGEAWIDLGLRSTVAASETNTGRWGGSGLYYRVCAGEKHIYVAFNCSFAASSSTVRVGASEIPSAYRPPYDVYALCPFGYADGGRGIATVSVSPSGRVNIYSLHRLTGTASGTETVAWIDGYIDFWT